MRISRFLTTLVITLLLGACALPAHNNTLIFSVKRKVGLGASASSEGMPNVYLGYSASELAWVPLWANGKTGPLPCDLPTPISGAGKADGSTYKDISCRHGPKLMADSDGMPGHNSHDAFSTFSSFGGDAGANASGADQSARVHGKLASFFATGVAAQHLSKHVGLVSDVFATAALTPPAGETGNSAKKQAASAGEFLTLTAEPDPAASKIRPACTRLLASKALLPADAAKAMAALPVTTVKAWEAGLLESQDLRAYLPIIAHAGTHLQKDFTAQLENRGRKELAASYCPV